MYNFAIGLGLGSWYGLWFRSKVVEWKVLNPLKIENAANP